MVNFNWTERDNDLWLEHCAFEQSVVEKYKYIKKCRDENKTIKMEEILKDDALKKAYAQYVTDLKRTYKDDVD